MFKKILNLIRERFIKSHPKAASAPRSMRKFADLIKNYTSINVNLIMEIGANYGQDAEGLRYYFKLNPT